MRIGPQRRVGHRILVMDMAIERAEAAGRRARRLGQCDAVALGARPDANQHAIGARGDICRDHRPIGGEPAIGDDHRLGIEPLAPRPNADASALLDDQRLGARAAKNLAAASSQRLLETLHQQIGAAPIPVEPATIEPARRRHHVLALRQRAAQLEARSRLHQPIMRAPGIPRDGMGKLGLRRSAGAVENGGRQNLGRVHQRDAHHAENAGRPARAAGIAVLAPRLEHRRLEAQLAGAAGRHQPGKAAADGYDVELHRGTISRRKQMARGIRRVVTGHNAQGQAVVKIDEMVEPEIDPERRCALRQAVDDGDEPGRQRRSL